MTRTTSKRGCSSHTSTSLGRTTVPRWSNCSKSCGAIVASVTTSRRKTMLKVFELLGNQGELVSEFRKKLATVMN